MNDPELTTLALMALAGFVAGWIDAVVGGLVIATIPNGLGLLNQASYINFVVTGGVLLLAASVDAVSRRRRSSAGV